MAIALDASSTSAIIGQNVASTTSPTFSPPANTVIFVVVSMTVAATATVTSVTNTGTALTWNRLAHDTNATPQGVTETWWASNVAAQTNITVTANYSANSYNVVSPVGILRVMVFTGAATSQTGATAVHNSGSLAAVTGSITTTVNNSWVWGSFATASGASETVGASQTMDVQQFHAGVGTYNTQYQNATTPTSGTVVTINLTTPASSFFTSNVFEVLPSSGSVNGTATLALGPLTLTATGTNIPVVNGTATLTLGPLALASTGIGIVAAQLLLGPLTLTATAIVAALPTPALVTTTDTPLATATSLTDRPLTTATLQDRT